MKTLKPLLIQKGSKRNYTALKMVLKQLRGSIQCTTLFVFKI